MIFMLKVYKSYNSVTTTKWERVPVLKKRIKIAVICLSLSINTFGDSKNSLSELFLLSIHNIFFGRKIRGKTKITSLSEG